MLATLSTEIPTGPRWVFEEKYDGIRALAYRTKRRVRLWSRNELDLTAGFPDIASAVAALPGGDLVLDGELVIFDQKGVSRFQLLQRRGAGGRSEYAVFDLLERDGASLLKRPLKERRRALEAVLGDRSVLRLSRRFGKNGPRAYETARQKQWEGVIAKDETSLYEPGVRSRSMRSLFAGPWSCSFSPRRSSVSFVLCVGGRPSWLWGVFLSFMPEKRRKYRALMPWHGPCACSDHERQAKDRELRKA
jgi:ATP-dependent DNA ligase